MSEVAALERRVLPAALLLFVALQALPALGLFRYGYDQVEYLDLARNLARGEGFVATLRPYLVGADGFPQPPQVTRPVLFPLLGGLAYAAVPDPRSLQALNLLLGLASVGLAYAVALRFGPRVAAATALALAASPTFGSDVTAPMSEASAIFAILGAVVLADRARASPARCAAVGLWLGLAYLARPATLPLAVVIAFYAVHGGAAAPRVRRVEALAATAAAAALAVLPLWLLNVRHGLPPLWAPGGYTVEALNFEVFLWDGYGAPRGGALSVIRTHPFEVLEQVARNARDAVRLLFVSPQRLGLLLLLWPAAARAALRAPAPTRRLAGLLTALGGLNVLTYVACWSAPIEDRYLSSSFVLLLPVGLLGLAAVMRGSGRRRGPTFWLPALLLLGVFAEGTLVSNVRTLRDVRAGRTRAFWDASSAEGSPATAAAAWLERRLPAGSSVAATNPWIFAFLLERPVAVLPRNLRAADLERFARRHDVAALVNLESSGRAAPPEVVAEAARRLGGSGRPVRFGRNAVYVVPARGGGPESAGTAGAPAAPSTAAPSSRNIS